MSRILSDEECAHIAIVNGTPVVQDLLSTILLYRAELRALNAPKEFPAPCHLCNKQIESETDLDWHGLGNCVPVCERCMGSGIEPSQSKEIREAEIRGMATAAKVICKSCREGKPLVFSPPGGYHNEFISHGGWSKCTAWKIQAEIKRLKEMPQ